MFAKTFCRPRYSTWYSQITMIQIYTILTTYRVVLVVFLCFIVQLCKAQHIDSVQQLASVEVVGVLYNEVIPLQICITKTSGNADK